MVSDERQISHNLLACALNASIWNRAGACQQLRAYAPIFSSIALHIEATFLPRQWSWRVTAESRTIRTFGTSISGNGSIWKIKAGAQTHDSKRKAYYHPNRGNTPRKSQGDSGALALGHHPTDRRSPWQAHNIFQQHLGLKRVAQSSGHCPELQARRCKAAR
jgi:hypothetical protein